MRGFFVTGTDTGVGKTFVTCALARQARARGQKVFAFKPIETGCEERNGTRVGPDQELLAAAAGDWQSGDLRGCYRFRQAAAPFVAARAEGVDIDLLRITHAIRAGAEGADLVLIEGAGGWRVPITDEVDTSGLAVLCPLPVVVVARAGLGTINHTLLTVQAIERDGMKVERVVLSQQPADDEAFTRSNAEQIEWRWKERVLVFDGRLDALDELVSLDW